MKLAIGNMCCQLDGAVYEEGRLEFVHRPHSIGNFLMCVIHVSLHFLPILWLFLLQGKQLPGTEYRVSIVPGKSMDLQTW